jgi:phage baseplate assembly protein gpV
MQLGLKYGLISQIDATKGLAKVSFDADVDSSNGNVLVSDWLPCLMRKTLNEKESYPFDEKEHVACLMDEHCEDGVILGAIYSDNELPALTTKDLFGIVWANGDLMKYDRQAQKYYIAIANLLQFNAGTNGGLVNVIPSVTKYNNLENLVNKLVNALNSWTPVPNDGGAALKALITTAAILPLTPTVRNDIEDTKITH